MDDYITVETLDGSFSAYIARPKLMPAPAIVVIHDVLGVNADLRDTCNELAAAGYIALSPDLFWRMEAGVEMSGHREGEWKKGFALFKAFDCETGVKDIAATMKAARALPGSGGKVGLMGFCLGGLMTFLATARIGADASVAYCSADIEKHLGEAANVGNPLMIHLGEEDEHLSQDTQHEIITRLKDDAGAQVFVYPGQSDAFARNCGARAHYDSGAVRLANSRTSSFFEMYLQPARHEKGADLTDDPFGLWVA